MKGNFYILALTTVLAHNSFAFDIQKGTILESKKWTTGNGSLQIVDAPLEKQNTLGKLFHKKKTPVKKQSTIENKIKAYTDINGIPEVILPGEIIKGYLFHNIGLSNNSDITKTYKVLMAHCLYSSTSDSEDCFKNKYTIQLEPNGKLEDVFNYEGVMFAAGNVVGSYQILQSTITIQGIEDSSQFETFAHKFIRVSDLVVSQDPLPLPQE